jgi:hypothetical protein
MNIKQVGITEMELPFGAYPSIFKNELQFHMANGVVKKMALPGEPKLARGESGRMVRLSSDRIHSGKLIPLYIYEFAVNPLIPAGEIRFLMRKLGKMGKNRKKDREEVILDMARFNLLVEDQKSNHKMMMKCTWMVKVYRCFPVAIGQKIHGNYGAVAYQQLCVVGG